MTPRFRWSHGLSIALAAAALLSLCYAVVAGSTPDEEEFRSAIVSTWLFVRGPWTLDSAFWTPLLGLGVPQPPLPSFRLHPLAPLLAWMPPIPWVSLFLVTHTVVGAIGMWRLGNVLRCPPIVRATGVVTFLFSAPIQNYLLTDFWPSSHIGWTLAPWVLLMAWHVLDPATPDSSARGWAAGLGLTAGIAAATAHPPYLAVFVPLAVLVVAAHWRMAIRRAVWIAAAALIAAAIAATVIVQLAVEYSLFGSELKRTIGADPLSLRAAWIALGYPFVGDQRARTLFFGAPYTALALVGSVWFFRPRPELALGVLGSAILLFTTWLPIPMVTLRYLFRDPVTLCGILLAGLVVTRLMARPATRSVGLVLVVLQLVAMGVGIPRATARNLDAEGRSALRFRGATGDTPLMDTLVEHMPSRGRLLYSPRTALAVERHSFMLDGLGVLSPAYRGIPVVNGLFKGISVETLWPAVCLFCGEIRTPPQLVELDNALDVLAIRYVLAFRDEAVAPGLEPLTTIAPQGEELVLYENADAWPVAFLLQPSFGDTDLPVIEGCGHDRLLCRDVGAIALHRDPAPIQVTRAADHIRVAFGQPSTASILVVSEMFRPAWTATLDGRPLAARSMFGGLIGVPLPAGGREVTLHYRPRAHRVALSASLAGVIAAAGLIAVGVFFRARRLE